MSATTRLPDGFEEAFDQLFGRAFRVARRILGDDAAAEDVAAETMARAYAHWAKIAHEPRREGWVVREVPYRCVPRNAGESKTGANLWDYLVKGRKYVSAIERIASEPGV